jgi:hemin uptake protein HemP
MSSTRSSEHRAPSTDPRTPPKIETAQLMQGRREILIQHGSQQYRLRITSAGKLILTK